MTELAILRCPRDRARLEVDGDDLHCAACDTRYPAQAGGFALLAGATADAARQADIYDHLLGEPTDFAHPHNLTLVHQRQLLDALALTSDQRVLEIGGHRSGALAYLEGKFGVRGVGFDISPVWVGAQNALARARGGRSQWHRADAVRLPLADGSIDAVVAFDVLEHVPDIHAAVAEIARVLVADGTLVCHQPVRDVAGSLDGLQKWWDHDGWTARQASVGHDRDNIPTKAGFARILEDAGLVVVAQRPFNVLVQPLHDHKLLPILGAVRRGLWRQGAAPNHDSAAPPGSPNSPREASGFQKVYARYAVPVWRAVASVDAIAAARGIGGSCSYVARRLG